MTWLVAAYGEQSLAPTAASHLSFFSFFPLLLGTLAYI